MTEADRRALYRLAGSDGAPRATTDDLQGLLLQVVFALLMIFMIAYFIFVDNQKKERVEEVMALNRQKLTLALEKTAEDHRIRYGLNALMTQGTDGQRTFEADEHVKDGALVLTPAAKSAFSQGSAAAAADYADVSRLAKTWRTEVFSAAGLAETDLKDEERAWFDKALGAEVDSVRRDARGVQRALAARLQRQWIENPASIVEGVSEADNAAFAGEVAERLKARSLKLVSDTIGTPVLP